MALKEAQDWIKAKYAAGAKEIGVSCNPIRRKLYLIADKERLELDGRTERETRILKDILHDFIGQLPTGFGEAQRKALATMKAPWQDEQDDYCEHCGHRLDVDGEYCRYCENL